MSARVTEMKKTRGAKRSRYKDGTTWTYFDRSSGRSFVESRNFSTAAKWYTFEAENLAEKARSFRQSP